MTRASAAATLGPGMFAADVPIHRLSVENVGVRYAAGILTGEDRVELLDGVLVDVTPTTPEHSGAVAWLTRHFANPVGDLEVRVQDVLLVPGGFVSPDLIRRHPQTRGYADLATCRDGDAIPTPVEAPPVDVTALLGPRGG